MNVIKRDGRKEPIMFDKITARLRKLCYGLDTSYVNIIEVSKKVIMGLYDGAFGLLLLITYFRAYRTNLMAKP